MACCPAPEAGRRQVWGRGVTRGGWSWLPGLHLASLLSAPHSWRPLGPGKGSVHGVERDRGLDGRHLRKRLGLGGSLSSAPGEPGGSLTRAGTVGEAGKGQGETGREKEAGKRKEGGERQEKNNQRQEETEMGERGDRETERKKSKRDRNKYTEGDREKSGMERGRNNTYKGENRDIGVQLGRGAGRESLNLGPEER